MSKSQPQDGWLTLAQACEVLAETRAQRDELLAAGAELVRTYISNPGTSYEFISCIGSVHIDENSEGAKQIRAKWDALRAAIARAESK